MELLNREACFSGHFPGRASAYTGIRTDMSPSNTDNVSTYTVMLQCNVTMQELSAGREVRCYGLSRKHAEYDYMPHGMIIYFSEFVCLFVFV